MIVREATLDDVSALVQLIGGYFQEASQWNDLTFCAETTARTAVQRVMEDDSFVLGAWLDDLLVGFVSVSLDRRLTIEHVAFEEMFYIHKDYRKSRAAILLAKAYVNKSLEMGAKKIYTSSTAGFGALPYTKLMQRMGFTIIKDGVCLEYGQV